MDSVPEDDLRLAVVGPANDVDLVVGPPSRTGAGTSLHSTPLTLTVSVLCAPLGAWGEEVKVSGGFFSSNV